jgi:hypothetical protein
MRLAMSWGSPAQVNGHVSQAAPGQAAWHHAARAVVRRHWLATALLTAGLVLRVLVLLADRPALVFVDSVRYLYNAYGMDPVGYSGVLHAILFIGNLDTVAVVQHLLGLGMAVVIYLLLLRHGVPRWLAALAMAPVLLDAYQLQIEQMIMPDTLFEALIVAGLAILLWPAPATAEGHYSPGWRRVVVAGIVLGTSATVAQVGEALILPPVIYLLAAGWAGRDWGGWRPAIGKAAAACGAFALPILVYCTGSYLVAGDFFLSHTGVTSLYGRTAAAADCATIKLPADERGLCPTRAQQAMGPDWLEYANASPIRPFYNHLPRGEADQLISSFNHQVLAQQPQRLLGAYVRDVVKPFALTRDTRPGDTSISRWQFQTKYTYYPPWTSEAVVKAMTARFGGGPPAVWRPVAGFLRSYQLHGGYTPGPLLLVCVLASLAACACLLRRRLEPATRRLGLTCLAMFASAACVLLASDVFEFSWRYQLPALVTLVPAGALGISVIIRSVAARRGPGAQPQPASLSAGR